MDAVPTLIPPAFVKEKDLISSASSFDICKAVANLVGHDNVTGCQNIKGLYRIYIKNNEAKIKLLSHKLAIQGQQVDVYSENPFRSGMTTPDDKVIKLTIKDLPLSKGNDSLKHFLEQNGITLRKPIQLAKARDPETKMLSDWYNGDRFAYVDEFNTPLPRNAKVGDTDIRIFYQNQIANKYNNEKLCTNCFSKDHFKKQCTNETVCRLCKKSGHKENDTESDCEARTKSPIKSIEVIGGQQDPISNFYREEFKVFGHNFKSPQQAYEYAKAIRRGEDKIADVILNTESPAYAKSQAKYMKIDPTWNDQKKDVMEQVLTAKMKQSATFIDRLVNTDRMRLVEVSKDPFWGNGLNHEQSTSTKIQFWPGKNMLGLILEDIRDKHKDEEHPKKDKASKPLSEVERRITRGTSGVEGGQTAK